MISHTYRNCILRTNRANHDLPISTYQSLLYPLKYPVSWLQVRRVGTFKKDLKLQIISWTKHFFGLPFLDWLQVNLCQKLSFLQNMGRTCCLHKLFWMSKTISVPNSTCSPHALSLEFSCIKLVHNSMNNLSSYCGLVDAK